MSARHETLLARIYSDGYCCLKGYLGLCQARGEKVKGMAANIGLSKDALWYHYRKSADGKIQCEKKADCLGPVIEEIRNSTEDPQPPPSLKPPGSPAR